MSGGRNNGGPTSHEARVGFTEGPWLIHAKHRWVVPAEDAFKEPADALPICQLRDPDERLTEDETLDNGFLIAAAPELYEALEEASQLSLDELFEWQRTKARAVLDKARGKLVGTEKSA